MQSWNSRAPIETLSTQALYPVAAPEFPTPSRDCSERRRAPILSARLLGMVTPEAPVSSKRVLLTPFKDTRSPKPERVIDEPDESGADVRSAMPPGWAGASRVSSLISVCSTGCESKIGRAHV